MMRPTAQASYLERIDTVYRRVDAMFVLLFLLEYAIGIALALWLSPWTYQGYSRAIHPHLILSVGLGFALCVLPAALCHFAPGQLVTRQVAAISQMLIGVLWIHITGGRIETHFHVFGSLAVLAAYRDPRVILSATAVVVVDHLVRGVWLPQSVFGMASGAGWRVVEHAAWVVFIDVFLLRSIRESRAEMRAGAQRQADLLDAQEARARSEAAAALNEQLMAARDHALELVQLKAQFMANVSHEIRTPMNGIIGLAGVLLDGPLSQDQRDTAKLLRRSGEHLLSVVNDVLDAAKLEEGKVELARESVDVRDLVASVAGMFTVAAREKALPLVIDVDDEVPWYVSADPVRIRQVLANLVGNAVKFTERGEVRMRVENSAEGLAFEVRDSGVGIDEDAQARLFRAFSQVDGSLTRRHGGTGLGLSISRQLVELMGGTIGCQSAPGQGTTMRFTVRAAACAAPPAPLEEEDAVTLPGMPAIGLPATLGVLAPQPLLSSPSVGPRSRTSLISGARPPGRSGIVLHRHVLLVEDNLITPRVATRMLEKLGCEVKVANNGAEGVAMSEAERFDVVLMDCQMPVMDGFAATAAILARPVHPPIIALTAHALPGDREKCLAAGMVDYLTKPLRADELRKVLERHTGAAAA